MIRCSLRALVSFLSPMAEILNKIISCITIYYIKCVFSWFLFSHIESATNWGFAVYKMKLGRFSLVFVCKGKLVKGQSCAITIGLLHCFDDTSLANADRDFLILNIFLLEFPSYSSHPSAYFGTSSPASSSPRAGWWPSSCASKV